MKVFTLGTADRQHYEFTKILNKHGIQVIFDVRRSPASPQSPQFSRDSLQRLCASQNTDYIYLGNDLGGPPGVELRPHEERRREKGERRNSSFVLYPLSFILSSWLASNEFKRCLGIIAGKAERRVTCVLCTERLPSNCHRMFFSDALSARGFEIVHILDEAGLWVPPQSRPRRVSEKRNRK